MKKIALIGIGKMGLTHARAYNIMDNAQIVAVCDVNKELADKFAADNNVNAYYSVEELIANCDFDVADICTPTFSHIVIIKQIAAAKKDICCEKPLALSVEDASEAIRVCKENGVVLFTAHVLRWFPEFAGMYETIKSGAIGDIVTVRTSRGGGFPAASPWFGDFTKSGGVIIDLIIHDFDWLRWTIGDVKSVYAKGLYDKNMSNKDYALVTLNFKNGTIGHVEGSWMRPGGFVAEVQVCGTKGMIEHNNTKACPLKIYKKEGNVTVTENPTVFTPYYKELKHFVDSLENGKTPSVTSQDALEAVKIACAAVESIKTDRVVEVGE